MVFEQITEPKLAHNAYLIGCDKTHEAAIIDPQRDIDRYLNIAAAHNLRIVTAVDTHIHADYLSGLRQFAERGDVQIIASGEGGKDWQFEWLVNSAYPHRLVRDGDSFPIGQIRFDVWHTPGHTPEHIALLITDTDADPDTAVGFISGDFVFVGDVGRPDLLERAAHQRGTMEHSARVLFHTLQRFKRLQPSLQLWPGHGAGSACGKALGTAPMSTIGTELGANPSLLEAVHEDRFVEYILSGQPEPPAYFGRMKEENRRGPAILQAYPQPVALTHQQIDAVLAQVNFVCADCRPWSEYNAGHLPKALWIPPDRQAPTVIGSYIEPQEHILLVARPDQVHDAVLDAIRVGVDHLDWYVTPEELSLYQLSHGQLHTIPEISMAMLPQYLGDDNAVVLDVRRSAELADTGRIDGTWQIPHLQLSLRHDELPSDRTIIVFCRTGNRSRIACGYLGRRGYRTVLADGGIVAWLEMNRPVVRSQAES